MRASDEEDDDWGDRRLEAMFERAAERQDDDPRPSLVTHRTQTAPPIAEVLDFEGSWTGRHAGAKEERIRALFGLSNARYHQILNRYIDTREALELNPMLVNRLRDLRARRTQQRASRVFTRKANRT